MKKQANKVKFIAIKKNQLKTIVGGLITTTTGTTSKAVVNKGVAGY